MRLKSALAGLFLVSAAFSAQALEVELTYVNGAFTESFDLNTTAGYPDPFGSGFNVLFFNTTNDSLGNNVFALSAPGFQTFPGNLIQTGLIGPGSSSGAIDDGIDPGTLYDGVNLVLNVAPGDSFATARGGALTVTAVPEVSTWTMMLCGFAALGFVGYRRRTASKA
jgi:hypothetical protein